MGAHFGVDDGAQLLGAERARCINFEDEVEAGVLTEEIPVGISHFIFDVSLFPDNISFFSEFWLIALICFAASFLHQTLVIVSCWKHGDHAL